MAEIQFHHVTKSFGQVVAVDDLCLTIPDRSFVTLLGPSGCGKTTTLRMIAGLEMPTRGEILLGDRVLSSGATLESIPPEKRGMGLVFQSYALWPHMTVADNIVFGLQMQGKSRAEQAKRLAELSTLLHIEGLEKRYPLQLSGGQQQRVALARMLAISPHVLLLDEPLSNLDARLRMEMRAELKRLHEQIGNTIVYVTHDQLEAMTMATHIAVMHNGKLQQFSSPMEIYRKPATLFVAEFVGSPSINLFRVDDPAESRACRSVLDRLIETGVEDGRSYASKVKTVGIRPECVCLLRSKADVPPGCWSYPVEIDTILPTGPEWIISVRVDQKIIFVTTNQEPQYQPRDAAFAVAALPNFLFFDAADVLLAHPGLEGRPESIQLPKGEN